MLALNESGALEMIAEAVDVVGYFDTIGEPLKYAMLGTPRTRLCVCHSHA